MGDFDDFMTDSVLVEPVLTIDRYGKPTYGPAVVYQARVDGQQRQVVDATGEERLTNGTVYIMGMPAIKPDDRLQLPAGFVPQNPLVIGVNVFTDELGPHHVEVNF